MTLPQTLATSGWHHSGRCDVWIERDGNELYAGLAMTLPKYLALAAGATAGLLLMGVLAAVANVQNINAEIRRHR